MSLYLFDHPRCNIQVLVPQKTRRRLCLNRAIPSHQATKIKYVISIQTLIRPANDETLQASFERPRCRRLLIHIATCAIIYPFLYFITWVAEGRSLFAVRTLVGLGTATVAFVIGFFLIDYATKFMEASSESPRKLSIEQ